MDLRKYFLSVPTDTSPAATTGSSSATKRPAEDKVDYEKKRRRVFVPTWKKEYSWLEYDNNNNTMFCTVCREFPQLADESNAFYKGTSHFRKDPIRTHAFSEKHRKCTRAQAALKSPGKTPMGKLLTKINKAQSEVLFRLFRTAFHIAKEELALTKFRNECKLQIANGLELNTTYLNDRACKDFIQAIAAVEKSQLCDTIKARRFLSVLADGSTDSGVVEQEIVYLRCINDKGEVVTKMVQCHPVKHANAEGVLSAIDKAVESVGVDQDTWLQKVVCANFDGASVMMGERTGVAGRLKQRIPHIITLHCVAHKLELAALDVVKNIKYVDTFEETLQAIFKIYYYSTKKRRELQDIGELLEEKVAHFSGLKSTRWLPSRFRCLKAIEKNFSVTVTHMESMASSNTKDVKPDDAAKAKGIVQEMKTEIFVRFLYFMLDYSNIMSKCSTNFQFDDLNIARKSQLVKSTIADLLQLKAEGGEYQKILDTKLTLDTEGEQMTYSGIPLTNQKRPSRLRGRPQQHGEPAEADLGALETPTWKMELNDLVNNTIKYLDKRFENLAQKPLSCFQVFDLTLLPVNREQLAAYGHEQIHDLVQHFDSVFTPDEKELIPQEWTSLKMWLAAHRGLNLHTVYTDLMQENPPHLSNILQLVKVLFTLSPSTAICERGFSCMNRVKTCYRTSLKSDTLNDLLSLSVSSDDVETFNPEKAVHHWLHSGKGTRHLTHRTPVRAGKDQPSPTEAVTSDEESSTSDMSDGFP